MSEERENNRSVKEFGDIKISDDVVASIAGISAAEVEGISSMAGSITNEKIKKIGIKNSSKGVKIVIEGKDVTADIYVTVQYGYSIPDITAEVQDKVVSGIENMTGLHVKNVNVHVVGIDIENK